MKTNKLEGKNMRVKKKDGRVQDFNPEKIKLSLEKVSDEIEKPFTGSDLINLTKSIEKTIKNSYEDLVSTDEIRKIVLDKLIKFGFTDIARAYDEFNKKFENSDNK